MTLYVNGERVDKQEVRAEAEGLRRRFRQMPVEERRARGWVDGEIEAQLEEWAQENVIERTLLRQEADKDATPAPEEAVERAWEEMTRRHGGREKLEASGFDRERARREVERRVRMDRLLGRATEKVRRPKQREIAEYYRKNRERFRQPEMVRAAHIVKNVDERQDEETARRAIEDAERQLEQGADFAELADKVSDCPGNGGDLGYFPRGRMVEEFEEVVFNLDAGERSGVFRTVFGFHIAKVVDRKEEGYRPLSEVGEEISRELYQQRVSEQLEKFVDRLRERAKIRRGDERAASEAQ